MNWAPMTFGKIRHYVTDYDEGNPAFSASICRYCNGRRWQCTVTRGPDTSQEITLHETLKDAKAYVGAAHPTRGKPRGDRNMNGTDRQVEWANQIKQAVIDGLATADVSGFPEVGRMVELCQSCEQANWWIDNRDKLGRFMEPNPPQSIGLAACEFVEHLDIIRERGGRICPAIYRPFRRANV